MKSQIVQHMSSSQGQPMFLVRAILKSKSLEEYTGLQGDYYDYWNWEVFPITSRTYNELTDLDRKLNPWGEYPVDNGLARIIVLISTIDYLKSGGDKACLMNKTVAHHN